VLRTDQRNHRGAEPVDEDAITPVEKARCPEDGVDVSLPALTGNPVLLQISR
jgi:hypothetical protein